MKKLFILILFLMAAVVVVRFVLGGAEDDWICQYGQWVKHGNPSAPKPDGGCGPEVVNRTREKLEDMSVCYSNSGSRMDFAKANEIAEVGCKGGKLKAEHICNDSTGTWWIDFEPNEPKEGCNPACVVDVERGTSEINWRCTGFIDNE